MENVLYALGSYIGLPFLLALLATGLGFVVDVLAWLIHGPPPPEEPPPAWAPTREFAPIPLARLG
ncbi:MAG: hypothetical protein HY059_08485 [Proteobacteria bacterium]|nr:hypothetical protein [Pseudomonadota bacterium]